MRNLTYLGTYSVLNNWTNIVQIGISHLSSKFISINCQLQIIIQMMEKYLHITLMVELNILLTEQEQPQTYHKHQEMNIRAWQTIAALALAIGTMLECTCRGTDMWEPNFDILLNYKIVWKIRRLGNYWCSKSLHSLTSRSSVIIYLWYLFLSTD